MQEPSKIVTQARAILNMEAEAIIKMIPRIDEEFVKAVDLIVNCVGRVITTGMGKPGYIAQKLSATMMSTGTPSFYLHPAQAIHGDLGMVTKHDVIIAISHSGETAEIINILPTLKKLAVPIIVICGHQDSTLAHYATCYLDAQIQQEACPLNLAPTTSTTTQLAMSDALAMVVMSQKKFSTQDFAFYHPGGSLGQIRLLTVKQLIEKTKRNPQITGDKLITDALFIMTQSGTGAITIVDNQQHLLGLLTDGDIRRQLKNHPDLLNQPVSSVMTLNPTTIDDTKYASDAIIIMENHQPNPITVLPVIDNKNSVKGMIHITDLIKNR